MSRFFASGNTSDLSSEEEDLLSTSEEELLSSSEEFSTDSEFDNDSDSDSGSGSDYDHVGPSYFLKKNFLKGGHDLDSDSDNEGRKVVKSAKEKLQDDIRESVDAIYNAKSLENWSAALVEFDRVGKLLVRANKQNFGIPNYFFKLLGQLDSAINEAAVDKDRKKLPADQSRAFNNLRQRVKKQTKEFAPYMEYFHANPEAFDSEVPVEVASATLQDEPGAVVGIVSGTIRSMSPVFTELKAIVELRGKKNIDKAEQVALLENLLVKAKQGCNTFEIISVYQTLLSARFDVQSYHSYMPEDLWKRSVRDANDFLDLLERESARYQVSEHGRSTDDIDIEPDANEQGMRVILGSVSSIVERLDDEFVKSLQNISPHSIEYIERLRDEAGLYKLIIRAQIYVEFTCGACEQLARMVLKRIDHIYYKPDLLIKLIEDTAWDGLWDGINLTESGLMTRGRGPDDVVKALSDFLAAQSSSAYTKPALFCYVYFLAVNNHFAAAKELFLDLKLYQHVPQADVSVQILYNRALVQLGLGAFKLGHIEESHHILSEISNSQRLKELLGQGFIGKYTSQATAAEKQKLLPFHMHINLELLECVFMTASLLIEIPALAASVASSTKDQKRKGGVRSFKSKLDFHEKQYFTGPPESIKDHLIYASKYLQKGNWAKAYDLVALIKIWTLFPDSELLLLMLKKQLQIEALRTYIFAYKSIFTKLSVAKLTTTFQLDAGEVAGIVERMLAADEFQGSLEENYVNFATDAPQRSKLQELAIIMNEKVGLLNEKNEKTSANGHGRKQNTQQQQQKEQKEFLQEESSRFRYANVTTNGEFSVST
ncbi:hypothetical protein METBISCDRAFT_17502 [Metschnikowia bicuspidata]|uniref:Eukaryotic translation initiation factor 3 subunit C n=1 Tax=Metschnikowia bicuspidata TaxID=27322 RepID=A0A4V1J2V8_9ASCO|nr:hypothetical protein METBISCDRAFT_17502 [Metschnikowia bicuspidata]